MKGEKFNKNIENKKEFIKKEEVLKTETFEKKINPEIVYSELKNQLGEDLLLSIKEELENPKITKEAIKLEHNKIENLKNKIENLKQKSESIIEDDLSQITFQDTREKSRFKEQVTQRLKELNSKNTQKENSLCCHE